MHIVLYLDYATPYVKLIDLQICMKKGWVNRGMNFDF